MEKGETSTSSEAVKSGRSLLKALIERYEGDPTRKGAVEVLKQIEEKAGEVYRSTLNKMVFGGFGLGVFSWAVAVTKQANLDLGRNNYSPFVIAKIVMLGSMVWAGPLIGIKLGDWLGKRVANEMCQKAAQRFDIADRHLSSKPEQNG